AVAQRARGVVALRASGVREPGAVHVRLRQASGLVVQRDADSGREVDAVVAGAAGEHARLDLPVVAVLGLDGARRRARGVVARGAVANVLRIRGLRRQRVGVVVVLVGQERAHVQLVDVVREVADRPAIDEPGLGGEGLDRAVRREGGLRLPVASLLGVADDAVPGLVAAPAVETRSGLL